MASPSTIQRTGRPDWTLMTAIHDALRRDLDQLIHTTASRAATRARWEVFSDQLRFHLAAEHAAMWPRVRTRLTGDPRGEALLEAMEDELWLIGPLQAMTDDAFDMDDTGPARLRHLLTRLRTKLASHLAHEEADALPLISQILSPGELEEVAVTIRGGTAVGRAAATVPWAVAGASPDVRNRVLSQLPAPARLLHRTLWLPCHTRNTPPL